MKWILAVLLFSSAASAQSPNSVLIPAAGHVQGANGTFFKSDIAIHNLRPVTQVVRVEWLPQTGTGRTVLTRDLTLLPNGVAQSDDFVEGIFSTDGLGSIVVHPIHSDGSADPGGRACDLEPNLDGTAGRRRKRVAVLSGHHVGGDR